MMTFSLFVCNSLIHRRKTPQIKFKLLIFPLSFALHFKDCKGSSDPPRHTSLVLFLIHGDKDPCRNFVLSLLQLQLQLKYLRSHCLNYTHLHGITISPKNNQINHKKKFKSNKHQHAFLSFLISRIYEPLRGFLSSES